MQLSTYADKSQFPHGDQNLYMVDRSTNKIYTWERVDPNGEGMFLEQLPPTGSIEFFDSAEGIPDVLRQNTFYIDARKEEVFVPLREYGLYKYCIYGRINDKHVFFLPNKESLPTVGVEGIVYMTEDKIQYRWIPQVDHPDGLEGGFVVDKEFKTHRTDAGSLAREKLVIRKNTIAAKFRRLMLVLFLLVLTFLGTVGYFGYKEWKNRVVEWRTDYQMCYVKLGNTIVEGHRKYRYQATTYLGYRFFDHSDVTETTELKPSSLAYRLVGYNGKESWLFENVGMGSIRDTKEIEKSSHYTFITANNIEVVSYDEFCGGSKPYDE